jgi:hypothetical protein
MHAAAPLAAHMAACTSRLSASLTCGCVEVEHVSAWLQASFDKVGGQ